MNPVIAKTLVAAAVVGLTSASLAQNLASQIGSVNRGIERLTLLPGPYLLSPARTTPTMAPQVKLGAALSFQSMPYGSPVFGNGGATFTPLFSGSLITRPMIRAVPSAGPAPTAPETDPLQFNHRLEAPPPQ